MGRKKAANNCEIKTVLKPSLTVPFDNGMSWPLVEKAKSNRIIEEIKKELPTAINKRPPSKGKTPKGRKRKRDTLPKEHKLFQNDLILIGINAVTKALERGPLLLVLVCKSAMPLNMTHHLISLCAIRDTPGCCINGLNAIMSEILAVKSVLAVGFKEKQDNPLQDLVEFITDKAPPLIVPWVNIWKSDPLLEKKLSSTKEGDDGERKTDKNSDQEEAIDGKASETKEPDADNAIVEGTIAVGITENKLAASCSNIQNCNSDLYELKKGMKRKLDDVSYSLYDTNFKFKEVEIKVKKKNKPS